MSEVYRTTKEIINIERYMMCNSLKIESFNLVFDKKFLVKA